MTLDLRSTVMGTTFFAESIVSIAQEAVFLLVLKPKL